jgi:diadenosine tetraphosphatase ApaH/serine/threonine PP2A family protein phosphatase
LRYAIFGDIHGNHDALDAVLADIAERQIDYMVCMGDIVGYGAEPRECIQRVRETGALCLVGNHDHAASGKLGVEFFNLYAKQAALWTRERLEDGDKEFLDSLGFVEHFQDFAVVHGSLHGPEMFNYVQTIFDAELSFEALDKPLLFYGHTHIPLTFFDTTPMTYTMDAEMEIDPAVKTLINVGSVGQPRDENPRACYAVYDDRAQKVELRRVPYDVEAAAAKIREAGLPEALAVRLELGK